LLERGREFIGPFLGGIVGQEATARGAEGKISCRALKSETHPIGHASVLGGDLVGSEILGTLRGKALHFGRGQGSLLFGRESGERAQLGAFSGKRPGKSGDIRGQGGQTAGQAIHFFDHRCKGDPRHLLHDVPQPRHPGTGTLGGLCAGLAQFLAHLRGKFGQERIGDERPSDEHLIEFGRGDAHGSGGDLKRAWQRLAQLAAQFLCRDLALAHDLLQGGEGPSGLLAR
jgi:hypothetical protein